MCSGVIAWFDFSWEAFATLVTGLAAVIGAIVIAIRQSKILSRQVDLQDRSLKNELFDKRYKVFERSEAFLAHILREADRPDAETERNFLIAKGEARFLFDSGVHEGLDQIWKQAIGFFMLTRIMKSTFDREGHYGKGNPEKEREALDAISESFRNLPDLFGEMKLG